jgi:hypothetical protein
MNLLHKIIGSGVKKYNPIRLFYYNPSGIENFGDQLNIPLIQKYSCRKVLEASSDNAEYVCIGSLLEQFLCTDGFPQLNKKPVTIWGAGFIADRGEHPFINSSGPECFKRPVVVKAVRGKLSLDRIRSMGIDTENIVLGDPGLLAVSLFNERPVQKQFRVGIIAHYVDQKEQVLDRFQNRLSDSLLISITDTPQRVISEIKSCEVIISSAMHGLIIADGLGIPNVRVKLSDKLTGGDYKFKDYYSVYGIDPCPMERRDLEQLTDDDISTIKSEYKIQADQVNAIASDLLNVIPFHK